MTSNREYTAIDRIADDHHDATVALSPLTATYLGVPGHDHEMDDFSPPATGRRPTSLGRRSRSWTQRNRWTTSTG